MNTKWYTDLYHQLLYFSGIFSQLQFMKISCIRPDTEECEIKVKEKKVVIKKNYWINTNLDPEVIDIFYKEILKEETNSILKNVNYFRSYLKCFYDYEISEFEMERILITIQNIRNTVKNDRAFFSSKDGYKILNIIKSSNAFYSKKTKDTTVSLYKIEHMGKPAIVKMYEYHPKYIFSKCLLEHRVENEIVFQKYAETLNDECDFISPQIYSYGTTSKLVKPDIPETKILFIIMEYIPGISLKCLDFRPDVCKQIYEIDQRLKRRMLNHNDIKSTNIIVSEKDGLVLLDYGESVNCL